MGLVGQTSPHIYLLLFLLLSIAVNSVRIIAIIIATIRVGRRHEGDWQTACIYDL